MLHLQGYTCTSMVGTYLGRLTLGQKFQPTLTGVPTILMGVDEGGTVVEGVTSDAESVPEREKVHIKLQITN